MNKDNVQSATRLVDSLRWTILQLNFKELEELQTYIAKRAVDSNYGQSTEPLHGFSVAVQAAQQRKLYHGDKE